MTDIYLATDDVFELLGVNADTTIFGGPGHETLSLRGYPAGTRLDGNIEAVQVFGAAEDTTLRVNASGQLELVANNAVYATFIGGLNQPVNLQFNDGNIILEQVASNSFKISNPVNPSDFESVNIYLSPTADSVTLGREALVREFGWVDQFTYISGGDTPDGYNIEADIYTGDATLRQGVVNVLETISDFILSDLPDSADYGGVDDLLLEIHFGDLPGLWGEARNLGYREEAGEGYLLPVRGMVTINSQAAQTIPQETFEALMMHEVLHTLGFASGTWGRLGLVDDYNGDLRFNGPTATAHYNSNFPSIAANDPLSHLGVPIETDGSPGTAGSHWDDATFGAEVMTGWIDYSGNYISTMTLAAFSDMGYDVML